MTTRPLSALTMLLSRHTKRREFITLVGGAAAWPLAARAQRRAKRATIGLLDSGAAAVVAALAAIFSGALPVAAQDYPARPITLVVPFPAGGGTMRWRAS